MRDFYLNLNEEVPIPDDDDPEVLAAIERGIRDVEEGRVYTRQQAEEKLEQWLARSKRLRSSGNEA